MQYDFRCVRINTSHVLAEAEEAEAAEEVVVVDTVEMVYLVHLHERSVMLQEELLGVKHVNSLSGRIQVPTLSLISG